MNLMEVPREAESESGGNVKGVAIGVVTQNDDPEGLCRVKVSYPWHEQPRESYWARLASPMAGKQRGLVLIPEIGDEVLLAFERDDLRFPFVLGALWNGKDQPPVANSDGKNDQRLFKSRKGHQLMFDDGSKGVVELSLNDGKKLRLDDDGMRFDDGKGNRFTVDSKGGALTIESTGKLTIKATSVSIQASGGLDIKAGAVMSLNGSVIKLN
ncbi:phage baseplate assembly protein V [Duganella sp. HH105]|uniref:phage baseplate assembly protein V n=1 Tax=Duganella sp. HH105 TaxID=1781067 RepID=UPI000877DBB8|nr:phage baseplate assembly protein V [Duganella sp. HH105]OEZ63937.1 phage-related baseplate assembly protein [Duganella sp. HH105]